MPEERVIPAVQTVAEFIIKVNGTEIPRSIARIAVNVTKMVNKLSSSRIVLQDGEASSGRFPLSEGNLFVPGNDIEIMAGEPDDPKSIFTGIIIKQALRIRESTAAQLIVECRHKAVKTTIGLNSACYHDITDAEAMEKLLKASGFAAGDLAIEATNATHAALVQYNCTDWDFVVNRAEVNGKVVLTNNEKIEVKTPTVSGSAALSLLHGATIIELDAEMDSRTQYSSVKSTAWDMANQVVAESVASAPQALEEEGNLTAAALADVSSPEVYVLNHSGAIAPQERKAWADAQLLKSRLAKIRGRVKFDGIATLNPGDVVELNGLGERFNGKAFVSGVRQDYDMANGWKTQAQFGNTPQWFAEEIQPVVPKAGGLLAGAIGLHIGIVTDNEDPDGEHRVRVKLPYINSDDEGVWARIAQADAGNNRGLFFRPEVGDEVVLGFLYDDPRQPVILGMLHSSALAAPLTASNDNYQKGYTSRTELKLLFDDEKKSIQIQTPGGNKITLSDDAKGITLEDENSNKIEMTPSGIKITAAKELALTGGTALSIGGPQITMSGDGTVSIKGGGSTKLESSGAMEIKGAVVKIN